MERTLINDRGSRIFISSTKWPGEYMISYRYPDGKMHIMFIKDVEAEVEILQVEGYSDISDRVDCTQPSSDYQCPRSHDAL
jgi:hypothetical protein